MKIHETSDKGKLAHNSYPEVLDKMKIHANHFMDTKFGSCELLLQMELELLVEDFVEINSPRNFWKFTDAIPRENVVSLGRIRPPQIILSLHNEFALPEQFGLSEKIDLHKFNQLLQ
jgi:hypothetical protein